MDETLGAILTELAEIRTIQEETKELIQQYTSDLREFGERFEEVLTQLENERRLDRWAED